MPTNTLYQGWYGVCCRLLPDRIPSNILKIFINQNTVNARINGIVAINNDVIQTGAIIEHPVSNFRYRGRYGNACQTAAARESIKSNRPYR
jgi:hypothetical protein